MAPFILTREEAKVPAPTATHLGFTTVLPPPVILDLIFKKDLKYVLLVGVSLRVKVLKKVPFIFYLKILD